MFFVFFFFFTSLMPAVDQRIWRAPLAAILLFCNINKIFLHVDAFFNGNMFLFCLPVNVCVFVSALMCT